MEKNDIVMITFVRDNSGPNVVKPVKGILETFALDITAQYTV